MNGKNLVFIPTGLNVPENEVLAATIQTLIDKKKDVTVVTCSGGKNYSCSKNIFSFKQICDLCKFKTSQNLKKIKGNFKLITTPKNIKNYKFCKKFTINNIKNYYYKNLDNGLASYSSYITNSRDKDLDGFFANKIIKYNLNTTNTLSDFFFSFLKKNQFSSIYSFNGRMNLYRPLLRVCEQYKLNYNNLETVFDDPKLRILNLGSAIVNDFDKIPKLINAYWKKNSKLNKKKIINQYYENTKNFTKAMENPSSFIGKQIINLMPRNWDKKKYNIVFYVSSEDEYEVIEKKNYKPIFKNQLELVLKICSIIKNYNNFHFWIRMHPNLENVNWDYSKNFNKNTFNFNNVDIIDPASEISTYALMEKADLIIGLRSRSLIEANFLKKPTLVIGKNYWTSLGPFIKVTSKAKLKSLILSKNTKSLDNISAQKYAYFWGSYGEFNKYISGKFYWSKDKRNVKIDFSFKGSKVKLTTLQQLIFIFFKLLEKFLLYLNFRFSKIF
jgi:hypothetical protein